EGAIRCTGTGILSAQLADGSSPPVQLHQCPAEGLTGVKQMVDPCALMNDGTVRCWAGLSPPVAGGARTGKPTAIEGVTDVVALDVGASHACALSTGGAVSCWGYNTQGQIDGKPSETFVWPPRRIDLPR
ncbi:MAG TPA: RCC1 domain-containing protein, partial [Nannocystis sp.]